MIKEREDDYETQVGIRATALEIMCREIITIIYHEMDTEGIRKVVAHQKKRLAPE